MKKILTFLARGLFMFSIIVLLPHATQAANPPATPSAPTAPAMNLNLGSPSPTYDASGNPLSNTCTPACDSQTQNCVSGVCVNKIQAGSTLAPSTPSNFVPLAPIPGLTNGVVANQQGLANFLNSLYLYLIGLAAVLAVIMIIWGGIEISTQDSISKHGAGRAKIQNAILGLVLVLSPALVFGIINPKILNLSINITPLDVHTGPPGSNGSAPATASSLGTALSNNQQFLPCTDPTTCDQNKNLCESKGGASSVQCYDPNNGQFYSPSLVSKSINGITSGMAGSFTTCSSSSQSLGVICTGATSIGGAQGAVTGNLYNSPYATLSRFSNSASAQSFTCTNSHQQGPNIFSGAAGTANSQYSYAMCIQLSYPYVDVYVSGVPRGPDPDTVAGETAYVQACTDLIDTLKQQGFQSTPVSRENVGPTKTPSCSDSAIKKYGAGATCYNVTATCGS